MNMWTMYSNRIFTTINESVAEDKQVPANLATQLFGYVSFLGSVVAIITIQKFPRRKLYLCSQFLLAAILISISIAIYNKLPLATISLILTEVVVFMLGVGGLQWL